jgi:hypothetical protein
MTGKLSIRFAVLLSCAVVPALPDTKIATSYTDAGQPIKTTIYAKDQRVRYDFGKGVVLLRQCDKKRIVQIDDAAKTYVSLPAEQPEPKGPSKITTEDKGEKKEIFGFTARHLKMTETTEGKKEHTETDGWYGDVKDLAACSAADSEVAGYPFAYTITTYREDGKPSSTVSMEVTELVTTALDASLFEIPAGYTEAGKEAKPKGEGATRVGAVAMRKAPTLPSVNRGAYDHMLAQLVAGKLEVVPLEDGSADAVQSKSKEFHCDYILYTNLSAIDKAATGRVGGMLRRAGTMSHVTNGDPYEARVDYQLVPVDGSSPALAATATGKTATTINWMNAVSLAANMTPMFMMTRTIGASSALNPSMMHALMQGSGYGSSMARMDPMMGGMSMFLKGTSVATGGNNAHNPAADAAVAAALDQVATAVLSTAAKSHAPAGGGK